LRIENGELRMEEDDDLRRNVAVGEKQLCRVKEGRSTLRLRRRNDLPYRTV